MSARALPLLLVALALAGCSSAPELACGDGTQEKDGVCVPTYTKLECAEGTVEEAGACVPAYPERTCGEHTAEVDGQCVADSGADVCAAGTVQRGDQCVAAKLQWLKLPFAAGAEVKVSQGFFGFDSHYGDQRYSVDFPTPEGTTVVAARGGRVLRIKEDSTKGCPSQECVNDGNFVMIDHGDGTFARYFHLQKDGALVNEGDVVCAGQPIALSGNTGWSSGPHLHLEVDDPFRASLPLVFEEIAVGGGVPVAGAVYVSKNAAPAACDLMVAPSSCPRDLFAHMGVVLTSDIPCAIASSSVDYPLTGTLTIPGAQLLIATKLEGQDWSFPCTQAGANDHFDTKLGWAKTAGVSSLYLMLAAADADCNVSGGWYASVPLLLQ